MQRPSERDDAVDPGGAQRRLKLQFHSRMMTDLMVLTGGKRLPSDDEIHTELRRAARAYGVWTPRLEAAWREQVGGMPTGLQSASYGTPDDSAPGELVNSSYQDVPEPVPSDEPGRTSASADESETEIVVTDQNMTEQQKREYDAKHGLFWHLGNIFSGLNWDGTTNRAYKARSDAILAEQRGYEPTIQRIDKAMSAPIGSDYYAVNPGFSLFDYPIENSGIYKWHLTGNGIAAGTIDLASVLPWGKAVGFLRAGLSLAEEGTVNLVPRLGQKGVDAARHNANVPVSDASGKIVTHQRLVSGSMTADEKALGFPQNMLATHTEARAVRGINLRPGDTMTITGQLPPCTPCRGAMNQAATETGAMIKYQWRQNGKTLTWVATPKRK